MDPEWLTTTDIARDLGVTAEAVRQWIRERRLRATVINAGSTGTRAVFRIRPTDYAAFRAAHVRDSLRDDWER